ncbi:hypothetical protein IGI04_031728 [Brassica rapa subsp. trilocularis]|uniref:Uncharacterized protein n=1 Tax=Brassica rapa subsp. trilocularis TaxID=1813537 RepID=A0ABQ7LUE5_BRACM|nr:hypothetical protein IGI04_031728 [Brassica rapa subsp. trilocularis]
MFFCSQSVAERSISQTVHIAVDSNKDFEQIMLLFRNLVIPWICWPLWRDRNLLISENRNLSPKEAATKGLALAREWSWENQQKLMKNKPLPDLSRKISLRQANEPEIVCKSDASWDKTLKKYGLAWIFSVIDTSETRQGYTTMDFLTPHSWQKH